MRTETKTEKFALCDSEGRILYISEDMFSRIRHPLDGANIRDFLDSMDRARFDCYRFSSEERITFSVHGVKGVGALMLERSNEGLILMFRCYFACRQGDLLPESRQIHPELFQTVRRELALSRAAVKEELSSLQTDGTRLGASINTMYRSSMLLLLSAEMFFGKGEDKVMNLLMPFLTEVADCVRRWVRRVDMDICLRGDPGLAACYEDSSFSLVLLAMLSVLNDISVSHRVEAEASATLDGAYLTMRTETSLSGPDFDIRPVGRIIFALPDELQLRAHLCDVVGCAYGYEVFCAKENGLFTFSVDMPHVRRGELYLKSDPFAFRDTEALCRRYFDYLFSEEGPR